MGQVVCLDDGGLQCWLVALVQLGSVYGLVLLLQLVFLAASSLSQWILAFGFRLFWVCLMVIVGMWGIRCHGYHQSLVCLLWVTTLVHRCLWGSLRVGVTLWPCFVFSKWESLTGLVEHVPSQVWLPVVPRKSGWWWMVWFLCLRVGEASVPGPHNFRIGTCNPNGLVNKASLFCMQESDLWLVSETHLTTGGLQHFRQELSQLGSSFRWMVHGQPVLPRKEGSASGQWAGVALIAKCPTRSLPVSWPEPLHHTGRLVAGVSFCRGLWISGVVMYGTPVGPTHPHARQTTEGLLHAAVHRIQQSVGCRFVAGDFNHDHDALEGVAKLRAMGFQDVQDLQFQRFGSLPQPTCRGATRRDFLFVSPELASRFVACRLDTLSWTDHASLLGEFAGLEGPEVKYLWPIPTPLQWDPHFCAPVVDFARQKDVDTVYREFWKVREDAAVRHSAVRGIDVLPSQLGRGRRTRPVPCKSNGAPLKPSRAGELNPSFFGYSLLHVHWFKQLRRLQSYKRLALAEQVTCSHVSHRELLWTSILRAPGFQPCFRGWWETRVRVVGDLAQVPISPPTGQVAVSLFETFKWDVQTLETHLNKHKNYVARLRKLDDVHQLYAQVRRDPPAQVDVMFQETSASVRQVCDDELAVEFDGLHRWTSDMPVYHQGRSVQVIHAEPDKLWVDDVSGVQPGDVIVQQSGHGRVEDLFEAFALQWKKRWIRHADVPAERWEVIISFARRFLRPVDAEPLTLTPTLLRAIVAGKKKKAATGLDGVSRADLMQLDSNGMLSLCSLYERAATTGDWPTAVVAGAVKSLAKVPSPTSPDHFRPVTVFSLVYRVWSSAESRYWLSKLDSVLDPLLLGNRPGRRATDAWRFVLDTLEEARNNGAVSSGLILDLEKAFNTLPRLPALMAVQLLGLPAPVITAWAGALALMRRHFHVRGSYCSGQLSDCGFPEGCGLSCLAMVAIDELFHLYLRQSCVMTQAISYVDNWELVFTSAEVVQESFQRVLEFAESLDLQIDQKKSFAWASDGVTRKALRSQGFQVQQACRDLGAQLTFTNQIRNQSVTSRIAGLHDFWIKLRHAKASFANRVRVVFTAAWPRALHGVSSCFVGKKHWVRLRSQFMQSMHLAFPGANALLQMMLGPVGLDPFVYSIIQTIRDFRDFGCTSLHWARMDAVNKGILTLPPSSVTEVLQSRLHSLGWQWLTDGLVQDLVGSFSLRAVGFSELHLRLTWAWPRIVSSLLQHRSDFEGFDNVDWLGTKRAVARLSLLDQATIRSYLTGAFFTRAHAYKWSSDGDHRCPMCGMNDGHYHRLWQCEWTRPERESVFGGNPIPAEQVVPVLVQHGWNLLPETWQMWTSYLTSIPDSIPGFLRLPQREVYDCFTDGSCNWPSESFRLASWAVVLSDPPSLDADLRSTQLACAGPLPGLLQSSFRAELFAVIAVAELALASGGLFRVWSDCAAVVHGFQLFVVAGVRLPACHAHFDLWDRLLHLLAVLGSGRLLVGKVPAHEDITAAGDDLERWAYVGNHAADTAARSANQARGAEFWSFWERHVKAVRQTSLEGDRVRELMLMISKKWHKHVSTEGRSLASTPRSAVRQFAVVWNGPTVVSFTGGLFSRRFGTIEERFVDWWNAGIDESRPVVWVSFAQLYLSWQLEQQHPGYVVVGGRWFDPQCNEGMTPEQWSWRKRAKWFRLCIQQLLKDAKVGTKTVSACRPCSEMIQGFVGCISLPCSSCRLAKVDMFLRSKLRRPILGTGQDLDLLPPAW